MFKDAPATEPLWDDEPQGGGWSSGPVTVALRAPAPEAPAADERPASPLETEVERSPRISPQQDKPVDKPRRGRLRRHPFVAALGLIAFVFAAAAAYLYWDYAGHFESTDDAYIAARQFSIAPRVSGNITAVPVTDNQHVAAGDVIARIDDRDYRVALEQAQAQVASAEADAQMDVQQAQINSSQAQLSQQQAGLVFAQQQAARYEDLVHSGYGSVQNAQQYTSQLHEQQAAVESAQAALKLAQRQMETLKAQRANAVASLAQAKAQRDQAELNLSYTTVRAAEPGRVVDLSAAVGEYVQPGTSLTMFVPNDIWVSANFKETQLDEMRPNQPATIEIDAYPDREIKSHVASVQPGSGTAFSLLPVENATGNWVKIVQRVPVKIVMDDPSTDVALGPGMSVEANVRVNPNPSLYERLRARLPSLYEQLKGWL
ncbi:MAG TPA: HlyD family secretion protein [Roseiarcus sp.]|nr:HlyD family secretion protein [Roseiarcus sp.]